MIDRISTPARRPAGPALLGLLLFALGLVSAPAALRADDEAGRWYLGAYTGRAAEDRMQEILSRYNTGFIDSWLVALAPGWVHARTGPVRWEVEGQVVRHWGEQDHWEFNAAYVARWMEFPWDRFVDTRFAIGLGASWATRVPPIEPRAKDPDSGESSRLLGHVIVEIEGAPPGGSDWSGFMRLHHRSGAKGLFDDVRGGSNFITLGLRRYF